MIGIRLKLLLCVDVLQIVEVLRTYHLSIIHHSIGAHIAAILQNRILRLLNPRRYGLHRSRIGLQCVPLLL